MMEKASHPERRWLIVVRCDQASTMTATAKNVLEILGKISVGKPHLAFNSKDGSLVGVFAKVAKPAGVIRAVLEKTSDTFDREFVWVLELGDAGSALGHNTGWVWLQQNPA